jgi:hypothetical protein
MVLTAYVLFIGLVFLDPFIVLPDFPGNLVVGLSIFAVIIILSVGAGVILSQGMCHWLLDEEGDGWDGFGTALRQYTTIVILLLVLVFWSGVTFSAAPMGGVALTALGGSISGMWLSGYAQNIPAARRVGWRRAMMLTWGSSWAAAAFLLYQLVEYSPPPRFVP